MSALKIGVLTFHRCINYGSYWQARCLTEGLRERGHNAVILDHHSPRVNLAEWKCAYRPVLPTPVPESDYPLYRKKMERFFRVFDTLPLSPRFPLSNATLPEEYDTVVVGSDEVWNLFHPWYGGCPLFYGEGLPAKQLVSYAASFGNYDASWGLEQAWADKLQSFEWISVRDENSRTIINNALGIEPELVLDPCLQFKVTPEERNGEQFQKPFIAVYGHNFSENFQRSIRQYARFRNLPLVSIGYRNDWADEQWITADPHDFAHFMAKAEAVATNFFHGCVFSLINQKPFVCASSFYRSNKVQGLMSLLGGEAHLVTEETPFHVFKTLLSERVSAAILQRLERLRHSSNAFLDQALDVQQFKVA